MNLRRWKWNFKN